MTTTFEIKAGWVEDGAGAAPDDEAFLTYSVPSGATGDIVIEGKSAPELARMVEALPDMLVALEAAEQTIAALIFADDHGGFLTEEQARPAYEKNVTLKAARAAIAKARGACPPPHPTPRHGCRGPSGHCRHRHPAGTEP